VDSQGLPKILIFDSGVGGLSILQAINRRHPYCSLFYASDNAAFPYGTKNEGYLINRVNRVLSRLQATVEPDLIVIACNSASTVALPSIRQCFAQPVIGVVPAIKPAARLSKTKVIGLLATPGTVKRAYTRQLIADYASDCQVISLGSNELVSLVERKLQGRPVHREQLSLLLAPLIDKIEMDTLVMACTHFPLLKTELQAILPQVSCWVDSADAIASRVTYWLECLQLQREANCLATVEHCCLFTAKTPEVSALSPYLLQQHLGEPQFVHVD
jgi:glutamate racemase